MEAALIQKEVLTDRRLKSLKPAPAGKRYMLWDAMTPDLGLRPKRSKVASKRGDGQATEWATEWLEGKDPVWRQRSVIEITRRDVIERLEEIKKRGGKYAARHALSAVRKLFNWTEEGERF